MTAFHGWDICKLIHLKYFSKPHRQNPTCDTQLILLLNRCLNYFAQSKKCSLLPGTMWDTRLRAGLPSVSLFSYRRLKRRIRIYASTILVGHHTLTPRASYLNAPIFSQSESEG